MPVFVSRSRQPWTIPATATFSNPRAVASEEQVCVANRFTSSA